MKTDPEELRARLADARLMLLFTPQACAGRDPIATLEAALPAVDLIQVRPKSAGSDAPCSAREAYEWTMAVLDLLAAHPAQRARVLVDDRVDVALALWPRGCAGVHLGQQDCPATVARGVLGPDPLVGLSTHTMGQVGAAEAEPVDYLGFGPVHATGTKGYARGLGAEACWVASRGTEVPLFPIGGIDATNAGDLAPVGRAAVCSAVLGAADPGRAAREILSMLAGSPPE